METLPKYTVLMPCRWGWFVGLKADPFQTGSVATQGEWAPNETEILLSFIKPGMTVLDVGANVGTMTLAMAAGVGPKGHVIAFEPQRLCYACLISNITLNSLLHFVEAIQCAIGNQAGTIQVPQLNATAQIMNFGGVSLTDEHNTPMEPVPLITIDSLNLSVCHLMKVDVEGMEPQVLEGAAQTIAKHRPVIWSEILDYRNTNERMVAILKQHNYKAWRVFTNIYSERNTRLSRHNMFMSDAGSSMQDHNILALPAEVTPPPWVHDIDPFV